MRAFPLLTPSVPTKVTPNLRAHRYRELAAAGLGDARAVLAWANKISRTQPENVLLRPTPHVTASGDVVMGLPLDPVVSAKVVDLVESVGDKTQWGNQRTAASRGQLLTYLRQNVTDQFLRDAIVRRAHAYWLYLDADSAPVPTLRVGA